MNSKEDPKTNEVQERHRVQLDFSAEAYERLTQIRSKSETRTNAEAVRNALRLYDWFLDLRRRDAKLLISEEGTVKEVEVLF